MVAVDFDHPGFRDDGNARYLVGWLAIDEQLAGRDSWVESVSDLGGFQHYTVLDCDFVFQIATGKNDVVVIF